MSSTASAPRLTIKTWSTGISHSPETLRDRSDFWHLELAPERALLRWLVRQTLGHIDGVQGCKPGALAFESALQAMLLPVYLKVALELLMHRALFGPERRRGVAFTRRAVVSLQVGHIVLLDRQQDELCTRIRRTGDTGGFSQDPRSLLPQRARAVSGLVVHTVVPLPCRSTTFRWSWTDDRQSIELISTIENWKAATALPGAALCRRQPPKPLPTEWARPSCDDLPP